MKVLLLFLMIPFFAHAGGSVVGNGGNTVDCPLHTQTDDVYVNHMAVLDVFEGKEYFGYHYKKLSSLRGQPFAQAFPKAVRLFYSRNAESYRLMMEKYTRMSELVSFEDDEKLPAMGSTSFIAINKKCNIRQAAIQYVPSLGTPTSDFTVQIARWMWKSLPTDQKVALIFHEFIEAFGFATHGHCVFHEARDLVAFILSDESLRTPNIEWNPKTQFSCDRLDESF